MLGVTDTRVYCELRFSPIAESLPTMTSDHRKSTASNDLPPPPSNPKLSSNNLGGQKPNYPNPPDRVNPDAATLRDQWRYAMRQYSKWYAHAWGTAILAGVSFFALGWVIKGSNPLPSFQTKDDSRDSPSPPPSGATVARQAR